MTTTPTERRLAITPVEAHIMDQHEAGTHLKGFKVIIADGSSDANHAPLYCDAYNTYNACGLTPSELPAKLRAAEKLLRAASEWMHVKRARMPIAEIDAFLSTLNIPQ